MSNTRVIVVNFLVLVLYLLAANPMITGLAIHEWISLGVFVVFVVHVAQNSDRLLDAFKALRTKPPLGSVGRLVLNSLTIITFMVAMVSGIMVSRFILPLFGLVSQGYFFWNPLHSVSAKILLALIVIHFLVNFRWFTTLFKSRAFKVKSEEKDH